MADRALLTCIRALEAARDAIDNKIATLRAVAGEPVARAPRGGRFGRGEAVRKYLEAFGEDSLTIRELSIRLHGVYDATVKERTCTQLQRMVAAGLLVRVRRGLYKKAEAPHDER